MYKALRLIRCAALHWTADQAASIGAALAFYCAFSLAPLLVILVGLISWLVGADSAYGQVHAQLASLFGVSTANILLAAMKSSQSDSGVTATIVSAVSLFIGATSVFAALQAALAQIFRTPVSTASGVWAFVRTRLLSFGFILAVGFLLLVSLTVTTVMASIRDSFPPSWQPLLSVVSALDFLIGVALVTALFAAMYKVMPARDLAWRPVLIGALTTAMLFEIGRWGVGLYLAKTTQPSAFGAAASFAALLLWLYYTAQIFLFGAEFTACLSGVDDVAANAAAQDHAARAAQSLRHQH